MYEVDRQSLFRDDLRRRIMGRATADAHLVICGEGSAGVEEPNPWDQEGDEREKREAPADSGVAFFEIGGWPAWK
jgi:hypothetical protein